MCDAYSSSIRTPRQEGLEPAPASAVRRGGQQSGLRIAMPENVSLLKRSVRPYARGGQGVHGRKQHDGKEADERRVAAAATVRVGDRRERLDAVHCRVPPYRCSEAARVIPKDENPEKPYTIKIPLDVANMFWYHACNSSTYVFILSLKERPQWRGVSVLKSRGAKNGCHK